VIEPVPLSTQAGFDVSKPLAVGELGEGHAEELIPAAEAADPSVAFVAADDPAELPAGEMLDELRENRASFVHSWLLAQGSRQDAPSETAAQIADTRRTPKLVGIPLIARSNAQVNRTALT
jgi:hypothetical protein